MSTPYTLRRILGECYRFFPSERQTAFRGGGAWKLGLRKLARPFFQYPVTVMSPEGTYFEVSTDPVDEHIAYHLTNRVYRQWYFPEPSINLPPNPVILDVGAHHGLYAMTALGYYPNSTAICVEPSRKAIPRIHKNMQINHFEKRVRTVNAALGDHDGIGYLHIDSQSWSNHLMSDGSTPDYFEEVHLLSLKAILQGEHPHIIKCNAEGGEFALVPQLKELDKLPLLVLLFIHVEKDLGSAEELITAMTQLGYNATTVIDDPMRPLIHFRLPG